MRLASLALALSAMTISAQSALTILPYPKPHTVDQVDTYFGTRVSDPYRWMEDLDSADTKTWVEAENKVTASYLDQLKTRPALQKRLSSLVNFERYSAPYRRGTRYFYSYNTGLQNQTPIYWTEGLKGEPHLLIDPNTLRADGTIALNGLSVSYDGTLAVTVLSEAGSDWTTMTIRDVATGKIHDDIIKWTKFGGAAWLHDNSGFFYTGYDAPPPGTDIMKAANYFPKVRFHKLGTPQSDDKVVFDRPDDKEIYLFASITDDGNYLILHQGRGTSPNNELAIKDLRHPDAPILKLIDKPDASYSIIDNDGAHFLLQTTLDAPMGKVIAIDLAHPERSAWKTVLPESKSNLEGASVLNKTLIATYLTDAHTQIEIFTPEGKHLRTLDLPGIGSARGFGGERTDTETFYTFTNFTTPPVVYRYDMKTQKSEVFRQPKLLFNPEEFETKEVFVPSTGGVKVPLFLTYKKGLKLDGNNATILYAYGGFNASMTPSFSSSRIAWMEMGGIYAEASLRGGGEYGESWHEAGTKTKKQNVFDDFYACAHWLIDNKYTSTPKLAASGGSNGGLLVGAAITQHPELWGAALPAVGVMDMLRFDKFTVGWGWKQDYGSPSENEAEFHAIYKYSPLHNIKPGTHYPPTMITTADHDDRVFPAHSFKFAATLQAAQAGPAPILIRIETRAGHGGGMPISKQIELTADVYAFLIQELHIDTKL